MMVLKRQGQQIESESAKWTMTEALQEYFKLSIIGFAVSRTSFFDIFSKFILVSLKVLTAYSKGL